MRALSRIALGLLLAGCAHTPRLHAPYPAPHSPATLPAVDRATVFEVGEDEVEEGAVHDWSDFFPVEGHSEAVPIKSTKKLEGAAAQRLIAAWRALPLNDDTQYMCHRPGFGLRFYAGEQLVLQTTVCFHCWNFVDSSGAFRGIDFRKPAGKAFYDAMREVMPQLRPVMVQQAVSFDDP